MRSARRNVPLARRNVLADRRRLVASALVVGLAVMLILVLGGLWAGVRAQATLYEDHTGAQLYVVAPGTQGLFTDSSAVPMRDVSVVRRTSGVTWAAPVRTQYVILDLHGTKAAVGLVGSEPGERGGVWSLATGHPPTADDEVVIDDVLAKRHALRVGSSVDVAGVSLRVVGIARGASSYMTGLAFVTHHATEIASRSPGVTSAVLVGTAQPGAVTRRLEAQGLTVLDHAQLRAASLQLMTHVFGTPMQLMVLVGEIAGTLVIALIAYTAVTERRREYGIVKAIGATGRRLVTLAVAQTFAIAAVGGVAGAGLFAVGRSIIAWYRPQFLLVVNAGTVLRAAAALVVMASIAAIVPVRRLVRLDPAVAYRGG
jgi:putative ABC transport system permease protein